MSPAGAGPSRFPAPMHFMDKWVVGTSSVSGTQQHAGEAGARVALPGPHGAVILSGWGEGDETLKEHGYREERGLTWSGEMGASLRGSDNKIIT